MRRSSTSDLWATSCLASCINLNMLVGWPLTPMVLQVLNSPSVTLPVNLDITHNRHVCSYFGIENQYALIEIDC